MATLGLQAGRTTVSFAAPDNLWQVVDSWASQDLIRESESSAASRHFRNAAGFGGRELYRSWHIEISGSSGSECTIEGWAKRRARDLSPVVWSVPKEIMLDVSGTDAVGYSGAAHEGRLVLNRLLVMLGQEPILSPNA